MDASDRQTVPDSSPLSLCTQHSALVAGSGIKLSLFFDLNNLTLTWFGR